MDFYKFIFCVFLLHGVLGLEDSFKRPKANRYKSPRENTTEIKEIDSTQKRSLPSQPQQASPRFGSGPIGLQKTPPDLQFGLAFTVPFVSLSTDKLINTFNGKSHNSNYGDVSNILKLNLSGLVIAAVVGIAAFLFIPSLIGGGKFGGSNSGWGNYGGSILDSLLPAGVLGGVLDHFGLGNHGGHSGGHGGHGWDENSGVSRPFGYQDYYEYNGVHNNRKDPPGVRSSRGVNGTNPVVQQLLKTIKTHAQKYVSKAEECLQAAVCRKAKEKAIEEKTNPKVEKNEEGDWLGLIESISGNDLIKGNKINSLIKSAGDRGRLGDCEQFDKIICF